MARAFTVRRRRFCRRFYCTDSNMAPALIAGAFTVQHRTGAPGMAPELPALIAGAGGPGRHVARFPGARKISSALDPGAMLTRAPEFSEFLKFENCYFFPPDIGREIPIGFLKIKIHFETVELFDVGNFQTDSKTFCFPARRARAAAGLTFSGAICAGAHGPASDRARQSVVASIPGRAAIAGQDGFALRRVYASNAIGFLVFKIGFETVNLFEIQNCGIATKTFVHPAKATPKNNSK